MTVRSVILVLLSLFAAIFLILNWQGIMAPVPVNLLFEQMEAPLGLILLVVLGALWCVGIVWALMQQAATLVEIRKAYKEANINKNLADHAEKSRIEQVRQSMEGEIKNFEESLLAAIKEVGESTKAVGDATQKNGEAANERMDALQKSVDERQQAAAQAVDERVAAMEKAVQERVSTMEQSVQERVAAFEKTMDTRVDALERGMQRLTTAVEAVTQRVGVVMPEMPAPEPEPEPEPQRRGGFFGFLGGNAKPEAKPTKEEPAKTEAKE